MCVGFFWSQLLSRGVKTVFTLTHVASVIRPLISVDMTGERRGEMYIHSQYKLFSLECLINTFYHFTGVWRAKNCLARVLKAARQCQLLYYANVNAIV